MNKKQMVEKMILLGCIDTVKGKRLMRETKDYVESVYNMCIPRRLAYLAKIKEEVK